MFGAAGVLVNEAWVKFRGREVETKKQLLALVRRYFHVAFESSIFLDDELKIEGRDVAVPIQNAHFAPWFRKILEWTGTSGDLYSD